MPFVLPAAGVDGTGAAEAGEVHLIAESLWVVAGRIGPGNPQAVELVDPRQVLNQPMDEGPGLKVSSQI